MPALKWTPAKRCYVFLCNDFNQSQPRIFNKSKHEFGSKENDFVSGPINQSRWSSVFVSCWKCRFWLGGNHIPNPTATKIKIISTVAAFKPFKSGLFRALWELREFQKNFYLRLSDKMPFSTEIRMGQHALLSLGGFECYKQSLREGSLTTEVSRKFHSTKEIETSQQLEC